MSGKLSVEQVLANLETQLAFHREREAEHARQEVWHEEQAAFHREQRALHAAEHEVSPYRRDCEIHQLQLVDPVEVAELLQRIGFSVQTLACYSSPLPQGLVGFLARKPGSGGTQQIVPADALKRSAEL